MIINGYSENLKIKYSEMDQNLALKPFSLLNFLQDIASKNAEEWGFGYSYIYPKNYAWFLLKYRIEFVDYPVGIYDLKLVTEPRGFNKLFAYRDFEIYNQDSLVGRASSMWSLVDIGSRSMVPVASVIVDNPRMAICTKREDDLSFAKVSQIKNPSLEKEYEVRYNDLDVNGHANNGNYIVWAFEPLSFDFKNSKKIKTIDMVFKKEARYGEKFISQIEFKGENITVHRLKNFEGEDLFLAECVWV